MLRCLCRTGEDGHGCGVGADGCGVYPGFGLLDRVIVDEIAGFEVVGGVEDEVGWGEQLVDIGWYQVGDMWVNGGRGVEERDLTMGGFGLGERLEGVGLVEEYLPLKVGGFDEVTIDEGEGADAGAGEEGGRGSSGGSDAYDGDVRGCESLLAGCSDAGKEDLTGVAIIDLDGDGFGGIGLGLLQRLGHGKGFVRFRGTAFRSIGNTGCDGELTDLAVVFSIKNLKECWLALCWAHCKVELRLFLRDAAVDWPHP
jgi:hypothetical protein